MHQPVLLKEVLEYLDPKPGKNFIDCTIGFGGHALAILEKTGPDGMVLGIDWSRATLEQLQIKFRAAPKRRLVLVQGNFSDLKKILKENIKISKYQDIKFHGLLLDLGLSSWQIEKSGRGFSFQKEDEPLDMRFGDSRLTAEKIINEWKEPELERIFKEYGEEKYAKRIAQNICQERQKEKILKTGQLVEIIRQATPRRYLFYRLHFATKVFQALRIAVNDELNNLSQTLPQALEILEPAGRIVAISFHSLEDRIVKNFFRERAKTEEIKDINPVFVSLARKSKQVCFSLARSQIKILTKKPIRPDLKEIKLNPRSRSARLRAAIKS